MAGSKRIRLEDDDQSLDDEKTEHRFAPKDYNFNFVPTIQPHQKIFDLDISKRDTSTPPADLGINTLTQRFISRSKSTSSSVSIIKPSYEPMYLRHRDISYTVIIYMQMAFNIIISSTVLYIFGNIILTVRQDFRLKAEEHTEALHKEKLVCTNNYIINHCGQNDRIPAIEDMCNEWAACMNRDKVVAQAKVSAEAIAEIINSFVEPISYKTLIFFSLLTLGTLVFSNVAFSIFKRNYKPTRAIQ
ncbi:Di-sulfide bridge nucleocytoplasmic transport domain-containing protein [Mucor lusitanicus]